MYHAWIQLEATQWVSMGLKSAAGELMTKVNNSSTMNQAF